LQSWGIRSRWNYRDSATEPTKSGVIGLIACAMGYKRGDPRIETKLSKQLKIGVRVERPGKIEVDYHTVKGDHTIATGKIKKDFTELTYRSYIEDASFLVVISGPEDLIKEIVEALKNPKWPVFLGRKSCIPSRPVFEKFTKEYGSISEALEKISWSKSYPESPKEETPEELKCVVEDVVGEKYRNDEVLINPARVYGIRRVSEFWVKNPTKSNR